MVSSNEDIIRHRVILSSVRKVPPEIPAKIYLQVCTLLIVPASRMSKCQCFLEGYTVTDA